MDNSQPQSQEKDAPGIPPQRNASKVKILLLNALSPQRIFQYILSQLAML